MKHAFDGPFPSFAVYRDGAVAAASAPFLVVGMYTASYRDRADRLMASCRAAGMAAILHEVPAVHRSISRIGSADMATTKAALIHTTIASFDKPVLYVDADIMFRERPAQVGTLAKSCDFAIYNWAADAWNDAWMPIEVRGGKGEIFSRRFWKFSHAVDLFDPAQLICSGAVQFWGASNAAMALLCDWQRAIAAFPGTADDECLDFAFNNRDNAALRFAWMDKAHLRYPWWPHAKPVIDHPDPVTAGAAAPDTLRAAGPRKRFYPERARLPSPPPQAFPRWAILDTEQAYLLRIANDEFVPVARVQNQFWM